MDKKKFFVAVAEMKSLTSDFSYIENKEVKELFAKMIVEKAQTLVKIADSGKLARSDECFEAL